MVMLAAIVFQLAEPVENGPWIVPAAAKKARPYWGIKGGIAVGLDTGDGPKGLLRIYAPYLKKDRYHCINFVAVEPIVGDQRGFSELEGRAMWTSNELEADPKPRDEPASGKIAKHELSFFLYLDAFKNGAQPIIQVILREDRPFEVGFRIYASKSSAKMKSCVLTATMGNYARLRHLWLKGEVVESTRIWTNFKPDAYGFGASHTWPLDRLARLNGEVIVAATPNEGDPSKAKYSSEVPSWWQYEGPVATQYWRKPDPQKSLIVRVNGRKTFWGHPKAEIPGGVAYENFELEEPYREGQEFGFGVTTDPPEKLGFEKAQRTNVTGGR